MRSWFRHRSVPAGALLVGALALMSSGVAGLALYLSVIRPGRGLSAATVGVAQASLARPPRGVASYTGQIVGPEDRETPRGEHAAAYVWRVYDPTRPGTTLCRGSAVDGLRLREGAIERALSDVANESSLATRTESPIPPRIFPACGAALESPRRDAFLYEERFVREGATVDAVGCVRGEGATAVLDACDDQPLTLFSHVERGEARRSVRVLLPRLLICAGSYALVCVAAAWVTLRRFERTRVVRT